MRPDAPGISRWDRYRKLAKYAQRQAERYLAEGKKFTAQAWLEVSEKALERATA